MGSDFFSRGKAQKTVSGPMSTRSNLSLLTCCAAQRADVVSCLLPSMTANMVCHLGLVCLLVSRQSQPKRVPITKDVPILAFWRMAFHRTNKTVCTRTTVDGTGSSIWARGWRNPNGSFAKWSCRKSTYFGKFPNQRQFQRKLKKGVWCLELAEFVFCKFPI